MPKSADRFAGASKELAKGPATQQPNCRDHRSSAVPLGHQDCPVIRILPTGSLMRRRTKGIASCESNAFLTDARRADAHAGPGSAGSAPPALTSAPYLTGPHRPAGCRAPSARASAPTLPARTMAADRAETASVLLGLPRQSRACRRRPSATGGARASCVQHTTSRVVSPRVVFQFGVGPLLQRPARQCCSTRPLVRARCRRRRRARRHRPAASARGAGPSSVSRRGCPCGPPRGCGPVVGAVAERLDKALAFRRQGDLQWVIRQRPRPGDRQVRGPR